MTQVSRVLTLVLFTAGWFFGQVIRVDVNLRQVDVVVNDAQGRLVTGLGPDDFLILEDGKAQKLTNFSWIEVAPPPTGAVLKALQERPSLWERFTGVPKFAKTPGNDILAAPVANPRKEEIRRAGWARRHDFREVGPSLDCSRTARDNYDPRFDGDLPTVHQR